jgi:hypothetical protein
MCPLFGFSIQEFFICIFCCQKPAFVCEFQHTPLWKLMIFSRFHTSWGMKICKHVPNSLKNKNLKRLISNLLEKWILWPPKHCSSLGHRGKKNSSTLNVMILQMVRNECLRFGVHVDIQVSYKILWLEIPIKVLILHQPHGFQKGLFWGNFDKKASFIL